MKFVLTALIKIKVINQFTCLFSAPGTQDDGATGRRMRKLSVGQYDNDVPGQPSYTRCGWMKSPATDQAVNPGSPIPLRETNEVNHEEFFKEYLLLNQMSSGESHVHAQCPHSV